MSFTGGKLKLKGGEPLKGSVDKKRKKKKSTALAVVDPDEPPPQQQVGMTRVCVGLTTAQICCCCHSWYKAWSVVHLQGDFETLEGQALQQEHEHVDRRTVAERKYDEIQAKRAAEKTKKMALKSHRERVAEFNAHLASLSEHHDIPKVGPG